MSIAVQAAAEGRAIMWGAPTDDQCGVGYEECKRAALGYASFRESPHREAKFPGGGIIRFRSLDNPDNAVGHTADGVVIDEAADVSPVAWSKVLRPMLLDTGGWAWIISTPEGRNWYWQGWQRALEDSDSMCWRAPSLGAEIREGQLIRVPHPLENTELAWAEVERLWRTQSEREFRQEVLAEFLEDAGGVFRGVAAVCTGEPAGPEEDHLYVAGVDWGQMNDFTVISVYDTTKRPVRQVALERFNMIGYQLQLGRLRGLLDAYQPMVTVAESNSMGMPLIEELQDDGYSVEPFNTSNASKKEAIEAFALAIERRDVILLDDKEQRNELESYTSERLPSGLIRYAAPVGLHDDIVMADCLGWTYARHNYNWEDNEESPAEAANRVFGRMVAESNETKPARLLGWGKRIEC